MMVSIYSVCDDRSGYMSVWHELNNMVAMRSFCDACRNPDSVFYRHPEDYKLYKLGSLNLETGEIVSVVRPELVISAKEVLEGGVSDVGNPV